jgi:hypothetical protein
MSRPSLKAIWTNLVTYDAPLPVKVKMLVSNVSARFHGQSCCGHPGQPGC